MPFSKIIPPFPLPQSPKDCSIHQCLFCCLAYSNVAYSNDNDVIITIILNSMFMC